VPAGARPGVIGLTFPSAAAAFTNRAITTASVHVGMGGQVLDPRGWTLSTYVPSAPSTEYPISTKLIAANSTADYDVLNEVRQWQAYGQDPLSGHAQRSFYLTTTDSDVVVDPDLWAQAGVWWMEPTTEFCGPVDGYYWCALPHSAVGWTANPDPNMRPSLDIASMAYAQAGSEVTYPREGENTSRFVELSATASSENVTSASFQYTAGTNRAWRDVPVTALRYKSTGIQPSSSSIAVTGQTSARLIWDLEKTPGGEVDGPIHVRALLDAGAAGGGGAAPDRTFRINRANPETSSGQVVGPAVVDRLTGDLAVHETDADVRAFLDDLALTRTYHSRGGAPRTTDMFGPGWTSSFEVDGGEMPYRSIYNFVDIQESQEIADWQINATDAYWETYDPAELSIEPLYETKRWETQYAILETAAGGKIPFRKSGADWIADDDHKDLSLTQSAGLFTLKGADGGTSTFVADAAGSPNYPASTYQGAGSANTTTYKYGTVGGRKRLQRIIAPSLPGVDCTTTTLPAGCRALELSWTTVSGSQRVTSVALLAADPSGQHAASSETLMTFHYDSSARLASATDARTSPTLSTLYTYDSAGRLSSVKEPGEVAWSYSYATIPGDNGAGRIRAVTRKDPAGVDAATTFSYNVPLSGAGAPNDLSTTAVNQWGQTDRPQTGTAIFPPDAVPPSTGTPTDWSRATIYYAGANGQTVNVADPLHAISTTEHDLHGNLIRSLTAANRVRALADPSPVTRSQHLDAQYSYAPNGVDLVEAFGPERQIRRPDGTSVLGRSHTRTAYDDGKPTAMTDDLHLPTLITSGATRSSDNVNIDEVQTTIQYSDGASNRGWEVRAPLKTIRTTPTQTLTTIDKYHPTYPLLVEHRTPDAAGTDPNVTYYSYYGIAQSFDPAWCTTTGPGLTSIAAAGGLGCARIPAAQPPTTPVVPGSYARYSYLWDPIEVQERTPTTSIRTTTTSRDLLGRATGVTVSGPGGAVPALTNTYNSLTGRLAVSTAGARTLQRTYDDNGRLATYVDADGGTTTYTYDHNGRTSTVQDPRGTTTYTYNAAGLATSQADTTLSAPITASYDPDGALLTETLPGGLQQVRTYDAAGDLASQQWQRTTGCTSGCTLVDSTVTRDALQRVATHHSLRADQSYTYDTVGRLSRVDDQRGTICTRRGYGYDLDSNRTQRTSQPSAAAGACGTGTTTTITTTVDDADRITDTGFTYDTLGRTITIPASASSLGAAATLTYDADDKLAGITAGTTTQVEERDPLRRLRAETSQGTGLASTASVLRYGDDADVATGLTRGAAWERYIGGPDDALTAVTTNGGATTFQLYNVHGDVVATMAAGATTLATETEYDEFGNQVWSSTTPPLAGTTAGWLGALNKRTAFKTGGIVHMGARAYAPALGRFLQEDPVVGGSANTYDYVNQDPVNQLDLDGTCAPLCVILAYEGGVAVAALVTGVTAAAVTVVALKATQAAIAYLKSRLSDDTGAFTSPFVFAKGGKTKNADTLTPGMLEAKRLRDLGKKHVEKDYQAFERVTKDIKKKSGEQHSSYSGNQKKPKKK
jgi:RHS repeat-associated protein